MKVNVTILLLVALIIPRIAVAEYSNTRRNEPSLLVNCTEETKCSTTNLSLACTSPWQYCDEGECRCGPEQHNEAVPCDVVSIARGYCITMKRDNETGYSTFIGECVYHTLFYQEVKKIESFNNPLKLNEAVCGRYNRTGILCGACEEGLYPLVYSFDTNCVRCTNKIYSAIKYILAVFLPLTIFYFIVMLLNINISSSYLTGYVLCCQGLAIPTVARGLLLVTQEQTAVRLIGSIFSIWNLDIFRFLKLDICLGTDSLQTLALDLVVGIYPLLLIILSYILIQLYDRNVKLLVIAWKPFKVFLSKFHKTWKVRTSLIDAITTFFILSSMKFLNVWVDLFIPASLYQLNSEGKFNYSWRLSYDATVPYFGKRHLPYAVLALAVLIVFVVTPVLLLILYPFRWFQKLLNLFPIRWYILHTFMDTLQGDYKDGTEPGTRDCRWFASSFLLIRLCAIILAVISFAFNIIIPLISMMLAITAILFIVIQPYKPSLAHYSSINATFLLLLAAAYTSVNGRYHARKIGSEALLIPFNVIYASIAIIILLYTSAIITKWMWSQRKFGVVVMRRFHAPRNGYNVLN